MSELTDEQILLIGRQHFKDGANTTDVTLNAYCDSVRAIITSYGLVEPSKSPLSDADIDTIAESMPGGMDGFLKGWGWRNFARAVEAEVLIAEPVVPEEVLHQQESLIHPATQVFFRAGLLACREYIARFVEHESPTIAASIRANWWPDLGQDFGPPRRLNWSEMTEGQYGEEDFRAKTADEISPTQEALPIALQFLLSLDPGNKRNSVTIDMGMEESFARSIAAAPTGDTA
jgi:hypothetical protein